MTDDRLDDDPLFEALSALADPRADEKRAERTRARCQEMLARRRERPSGWSWVVRAWRPVVETSFVAALALFYLGGAVRHVLMLLGR